MTLLDLMPIVWSGIAVLCGTLSLTGDRYAGDAALSASLSLAVSLCGFQPYIQCIVFFAAAALLFAARFIRHIFQSR
jgi:hypothetical protein